MVLGPPTIQYPHCCTHTLDVQGMEADEFVEGMKRAGKRVPGIGHRIKSKDNRDARVELLQVYAREHFPSTKHLEYALTVEVRGRSDL